MASTHKELLGSERATVWAGRLFSPLPRQAWAIVHFVNVTPRFLFTGVYLDVNQWLHTPKLAYSPIVLWAECCHSAIWLGRMAGRMAQSDEARQISAEAIEIENDNANEIPPLAATSTPGSVIAGEIIEFAEFAEFERVDLGEMAVVEEDNVEIFGGETAAGAKRITICFLSSQQRCVCTLACQWVVVGTIREVWSIMVAERLRGCGTGKQRRPVTVCLWRQACFIDRLVSSLQATKPVEGAPEQRGLLRAAADRVGAFQMRRQALGDPLTPTGQQVRQEQKRVTTPLQAVRVASSLANNLSVKIETEESEKTCRQPTPSAHSNRRSTNACGPWANTDPNVRSGTYTPLSRLSHAPGPVKRSWGTTLESKYEWSWVIACYTTGTRGWCADIIASAFDSMRIARTVRF
ncbi:hypothetical protein GGX14DRAFT_393892 [Mycena pura]|uniref:Uncharacterized protein n=1 Tax=Mycena pura TaxID=153505 RepID=A0AAD6VJI6_9AGAR|nr:hypothetical protein GGX14DRAFT_393892 [Mycena pura]